MKQLRENKDGEPILLQTGEKNKRLESSVKKQTHKPLEQSGLKPQKLDFTSSPAQPFSLLDADLDKADGDMGRFSIALN